jgi:glycosyltransferase involved in cell wall biosynthesis
LISPAAYDAAHAEGVPVVQTLHNFRLICPNALFFREGRICEDCLGKSVPWPGVVHKCYRGSLSASTTVATMLTVHRARGTWQNRVDQYIALTEFSRSKLIEGGLPADLIAVKPNFVYPDPGVGRGSGRFAIFVGRLSEEKGLGVLLEAWKELNVPLKIVGDGPLASKLSDAPSAVQWLGRRSAQEVYELIGAASLLVLPSQCYENFPRVIAEAFAKGTPVLASRLGAMAELIEDGRTGLHFQPGDAADLAAGVRKFWNLPSEKVDEMRRAARQQFEEKYTSDANHRILLSLYESAISRRAPVTHGAEVGGRV